MNLSQFVSEIYSESTIILCAKEHNDKNYWARKLWCKNYEWILNEQKEMHTKYVQQFRELQTLLKSQLPSSLQYHNEELQLHKPRSVFPKTCLRNQAYGRY